MYTTGNKKNQLYAKTYIGVLNKLNVKIDK